MNSSQVQPIVLIADDDPDDQLLMREAFAERGRDCRLCFAGDGEQLMRVLHRAEHLPGDTTALCSNPDLILLDLNMPRKDGREVLRDIKSDPQLQTIPTVVMTTSDDTEDIGFCYQAGADSYIIKPTTYSGLLDVVSSLSEYWTTTVTRPKSTRPHDHE